MDNIFAYASSTAEAYEIYLEQNSFFKRAGMNVREFFSNETEFLEKIPECDRDPGTSHKLLGIPWTLPEDSISISFPQEDKDEWTRRDILSALASIFDPMGHVDPSRLLAKHFFQKIWLSKKNKTPFHVPKMSGIKKLVMHNYRSGKLSFLNGRLVQK